MAFIPQEQLARMGFKSLGKDVLISDKASLYGLQHISIGDHSRVDDFCILSAGAGGIQIGRYVHISCYASLIGQSAITVGDYANISGRTSVYSSSDDFTGAAMTGPLVGTAYTNVQHAPVQVGRHVIIGAGSVVLPGVTIGEGVSAGALSVITRDCAPGGIYVGQPARRVKERQQGFLEKEQQLLRDQGHA